MLLAAAANVAASAAREAPSDGTRLTAGSVVDAARLTPVRVRGTKPLGAAALDLVRKGYVEREFYASGEANRYSGATSGTLTTAEVVDTNNPYKTRVLVRYPTNPKNFNGTLVVEWQNVTGTQDIDFTFSESHEHLLRRGYAYAAVSAQNVGVDHLRRWSPARYGTLSITAPPTSDGDVDVLSWDIMAQVSRALELNRGKTKPLPGLVVERMIANGESQSAMRLTTYYNTIHPLHRLFDAFLYYDGAGELRKNLKTPAITVDSEVLAGLTPGVEGDSKFVRRWEVAGSSHVSLYGARYVDKMTVRDGSLPGGASFSQVIKATGCAYTPLWSTVDNGYVLNAAISALNRWIRGGREAAPSKYFARDDAGNLLFRSDGRVRGGVQLSQFSLPTAMQPNNVGGLFCILAGHHKNYTAEELRTRYGSHRNYVSKVQQSLLRSVRQGYMVPKDARIALAQARRSDVAK